jgi:hypothetical protein
VADGAVLGRLAVIGVLLLAGWGAHRAVRVLGVPARLAAGALAVWNPFVVERLGLGQWAVLTGYAALFWLLRALTDQGTAADRRRRAAPWLLLGALTPTGAVLVGTATVVVGVRRRADLALACLAAAVQLPWLLPAVLGTASTLSDPSAVAAFAARAERPGPAVLSLVGLGGIWDAQSVPGSRSGVLGHVTTALVVLALVVAARSTIRPPVLSGRVWALGVGGLLVAGATTVGPVAAAAAALTDVVPGMGLLRDGQKWLAPFVVLAVLAVAVLVEQVLEWTRRRAPVLAQAAVVLAVTLPFVLMPDGAVVVNRVLTPVQYPDDFRAVAQALRQDPGRSSGAALASAPWRLYRAYPWAGDYATYDPTSRWFDVRVLTSDELVVGGRVVSGEDPWAGRVGALIRSPGREIATALGKEGVGWLLVHREDPDADALVAAVELDGSATRVVDGRSLVLFRLDGADAAAVRAAQPAPWTVVLVAVIDLLVLVALTLQALGRTSLRGRTRSVTLA